MPESAWRAKLPEWSRLAYGKGKFDPVFGNGPLCSERQGPFGNAGWLILGRFLHVIDDEKLARSFGRFEFQPELF
jgi:hypothetical protein